MGAYNSQTGGYTYMSDNISGGGNWDFWTTTSYGVALDKARLFRLDYRLWFNGLRRKDFDIAYDNHSTQLCYVLRTELGNSLYFKYQKDKLSINLGGKVEWKHGTSDRSNFERICRAPCMRWADRARQRNGTIPCQAMRCCI
jgi:hypothetical protein